MASRISEKKKVKIRGLRKEGLSYEKIAKRVDSSRETVRRICDPKVREKEKVCAAKYRARHKEEKRIYDAKRYTKWYKENKKKILAHQAEYRKGHKEEVAARHARYRKGHKAERKLQHAKYYKENRKKILAQSAKYREENKEKIRKYWSSPRGLAIGRNNQHRRRELKKNGDGLTLEEYERIWKGQDGKCAYCGQPMIRYKDIEGTLFQKTVPRSGSNYCNVDHIVPLSEGGLHESSNVVLACRKCNIEKGAETWEPNEEALCGSS